MLYHHGSANFPFLCISAAHIWPSLQVFFNYLTISQAAECSYPLIVVLQNFYPRSPFPLQQLTLYLAKAFREPLILNPKGRPRERRITGATEGPTQGGGARAHPKAALENAKVRALWQDWPYEKVLPNPKEPLESD